MSTFYTFQKVTLFVLVNVFLCTGYAQETWVKTGAGTEFSAALKSDGTLWTWGVNLNGQLGIGSNAQQNLPVEVESEIAWTDFACGGFYLLAIKEDGTLWGSGLNFSGELGLGAAPTQVNSIVQIGEDSDWMHVYAGQAHSIAIKQDGSLWGWGWNFYGQIGVGNTNNQIVPTAIDTNWQWLKAACGGAHTLALRSDSTLWAFGANLTGQLGEAIDSQSLTPIQVGTETDWVDITAGFEFSAGRKSNNSLWTWGFNGNGQLGQGDNVNRIVPTQVGNITDWTHISAGSNYLFVIDSDNALFSCGFNASGQLGIGSTQQQTALVQVGEDNDWAQISGACGAVSGGLLYGAHSVGLKIQRNSICVSGANNGGQLGEGSTNPIWEITCQTGLLNVSINESEISLFDVILYPNPTKDIANLQIEIEKFEKLVCKVYTITGTLVLEKVIENNPLTLNLNHLDKGVYMVVVENETTSIIKRLILN